MFVNSGNRVIGIDPGVSTTGYGVVEKIPSGIVALEFGVIRTPPDLPIESRLGLLFAEIETQIDRLSPASMAVERVLFQSNVKTAMSVGQATGAILVAAERAGLEVTFYSPNEVKQAVAGYGAADKRQVTAMVTRVLKLEDPPRPADAADALAIAIAHANSIGLRAKLAEAGA